MVPSTNTTHPLTVEDVNTTTSRDTGTHTPPTITIKETTSTMPLGSLLTTSATTTNKPTSTTESLGEDIDHFTTRDQTTTGLVPDKKDDVAVMNVDSELQLTIILSATSLAMSIVLPLATFILVVYLYTHKREAKESKSAKIELTKTEELTTHINPTRTFNTYN